MGKVEQSAALAQETRPPMPWYRHVRERLLTSTLWGASQALRLVPGIGTLHRQTTIHRDIPYTDSGLRSHLLDVYIPPEHIIPHEQAVSAPKPAVIYIHGGGFQLLSKETHWSMAMRFVAEGYIVFNINYRLAPAHRYPAALVDVCDAILWVQQNASRFGADPEHLILAGESAGANLATAAALAASYQTPEGWAQRFWQRAPAIRSVIAGCGVLQVSDPERFARRKPMPPWITQTLREVSAYLPNHLEAKPGQWVLADPLCWLERGEHPARKLPSFFAFVGTRDPLLDDTRRLHRALTSLAAACEVHYYPGGIHAFHAIPWSRQAQQCWADQFAFLKTTLQLTSPSSP